MPNEDINAKNALLERSNQKDAAKREPNVSQTSRDIHEILPKYLELEPINWLAAYMILPFCCLLLALVFHFQCVHFHM